MASASPPFNLRPRRAGGSSLQLLLPSTHTHLTVTDVCSRPDVCLPSAPPAASTYITRSPAPHLQPVLTLDMNLCLLFVPKDAKPSLIWRDGRGNTHPAVSRRSGITCLRLFWQQQRHRLTAPHFTGAVSFLHGFDACLQKRVERQDLRLLSATKDEVAMKLGLKRSQSADSSEERGERLLFYTKPHSIYQKSTKKMNLRESIAKI